MTKLVSTLIALHKIYAKLIPAYHLKFVFVKSLEKKTSFVTAIVFSNTSSEFLQGCK